MEVRQKRKPDYIAKVVVDDGSKEGRWTNIGVAFKHDKSIQVLSDVLPTGKVVLTPYGEREEQHRFSS